MSRASLVAGLALTCLASSGGAQSIAPLRLGVALGTTVGDNSWIPDGAHAALSLTSQPAGSRFGLRVEALFYGSESYRPATFGVGSSWFTQQTVALTLNMTYRLIGRRTGLYAIAGVGLFRQWAEGRLELFLPDTTIEQSATSTGLSLNAGLGYDFKAFGHDVFIESRLFSGVFGSRVPISVGIRF